MDKPTISPQSNKLLEMCQAVLQGKSSPDQLSSLLDEMFDGLEKAQNDFLDQIQKQGEEYIEKMQIETDMVLAAFEDYQAALDHISGFFQNKNPEQINKGMEMIIHATNAILDTLTVYESKSLQLGPTSFPILNMLILLSETFKKGDLPEDEFRFMIYNAGQFFEKLVDETEKYEGEKAKKAIETLKEGYLKFLEGLEKLDEGAKGHNDLVIDDALEIIRDSQEIIKKGFTLFNEEMFLNEPTESPYANLLISTVNGVKDGTFPKELLADNLEKYQEHMDSIRIDVEGVSAIPLEDQEIENEIPNTIQALDISDEACDLIRAYLQDGNALHVKPAIDKLIEATAMLRDSQQKYEEIGEREGKVPCIKCGALNEAGVKTCSSCGAMVPVSYGDNIETSFSMDESGKASATGVPDFVMTDHLEKLVNDSARVRDDMISFEEYSKTLDWMEGLIKSSLTKGANIQNINLDSVPEEEKEAAAEQMKMAEETKALLIEGLEEFQSAIDTMRLFGKDNDNEHLRKGLEKAVEASMKLHQVQKIGEIAENMGKGGEQGEDKSPEEFLSLEDNAVISASGFDGKI